VIIKDLEIDDFGVWHGLRLARLSDGLTVVSGANEAGKSTVMDFIRAVLYGFAPELRRRYIPPASGGKAGGWVDVVGPAGPCRIARHWHPSTEGGEFEQVRVTGSDGTPLALDARERPLSSVGAAVYNNVFAVGLRELAELGTLDDTEAAALLYQLTSAFDRVSLVEVLRDLEAARRRLFSDGEPGAKIARLATEYESLTRQIDPLPASARAYRQLLDRRKTTKAEISDFERRIDEWEQQARRFEIAASLGDKWNERAGINGELASIERMADLPVDALKRLDEANHRIAQASRRLTVARRRRAARRAAARAVRFDAAVCQVALRIEALGENLDWITDIERQMLAIRAELVDLEAQRTAEPTQLGLTADESSRVAQRLSPRRRSALRAAARAMRDAHARRRSKRDAAAVSQRSAAALTQEIRAAMASHGADDLRSAVDDAGTQVSLLRRRIQLDERLDQMLRQQSDLDDDQRDWLDRQVLPIGVLAGLGVLFVVGAVLIMAGVFLPESLVGSLGWAMAVLGALGAAGASITRFVLDRSAARQLELCRQQAEMLLGQIEQAKAECEQLDGRLPRGGGPLATRLQAAEAGLRVLEDLLPLDGRRQLADQAARGAQARMKEARADCVAARQRWRQALGDAGLPTGLSPRRARRLLVTIGRHAQWQQQADRRAAELDPLRRTIAGVASHVTDVFRDTGLSPQSESVAERIRQLQEVLAQARKLAHKQRRLIARAKSTRIRCVRLRRALATWQRRRRALFVAAGVSDEDELRRCAVRQARVGLLQAQCVALSRDIQAALAGVCSEAELGELLNDRPDGYIEERWHECATRLEECRHRHESLHERLGELNQQLKQLEESRSLENKLLELGAVDEQLRAAIEQWHVLSVTWGILDTIRIRYERDRQPETLREASEYLRQLTSGKYTRIWTPLCEPVLRVDDIQGRTWPVEVLSRGTREQLFLSLRLALVASYARRGARLPMVLDDLLVNFDARRAAAAAVVLRDFAAAGHQILLFTCHEHLAATFRSLEVPVRELADAEQAAIAPPASTEIKRKKHKRRLPAPAKHELAAAMDHGQRDREASEIAVLRPPSAGRERSHLRPPITPPGAVVATIRHADAIDVNDTLRSVGRVEHDEDLDDWDRMCEAGEDDLRAA